MTGSGFGSLCWVQSEATSVGFARGLCVAISGCVCWRLAGEERSLSHVTRLLSGSMFISSFCWSLIPKTAVLGFDGANGSNRVKMEASRQVVIWIWSDLPCGLGHHESTSSPDFRRRNMDVAAFVLKRSCK